MPLTLREQEGTDVATSDMRDQLVRATSKHIRVRTSGISNDNNHDVCYDYYHNYAEQALPTLHSPLPHQGDDDELFGDVLEPPDPT